MTLAMEADTTRLNPSSRSCLRAQNVARQLSSAPAPRRQVPCSKHSSLRGGHIASASSSRTRSRNETEPATVRAQVATTKIQMTSPKDRRTRVSEHARQRSGSRGSARPDAQLRVRARMGRQRVCGSSVSRRYDRSHRMVPIDRRCAAAPHRRCYGLEARSCVSVITALPADAGGLGAGRRRFLYSHPGHRYDYRDGSSFAGHLVRGG